MNIVKRLETLKNLLTIKQPPNGQNTIMLSHAHNKADKFLAIILILHIIGTIISIYHLLWSAAKKASVGEFFFSTFFLLLLANITMYFFSIISFTNDHTDCLSKTEKSKYKTLAYKLSTIALSAYMALFSINDMYLLGLYNKNQYEAVCTIYTPRNVKPKACEKYESSMEADNSLKNRMLIKNLPDILSNLQ